MGRKYLVVVGGTWEKKWGMLGAVVADATNRGWTVVWVDYPASYATPEAYQDSEDRGVTQLILVLRGLDHVGPIAVLGFSQGSAVVEQGLRFMRSTGSFTNQSVLQRIKYVGLCGNPYRAAGDQVGDNPGGYGVIGPLAGHRDRPIAGRWDNFALPGDLISSADADSLVRLVFPFTRWMSIQTPARWVVDIIPKLSAVWLVRNIPELRDIRQIPKLIGRIRRADAAVDYYLRSGIHGQYMTRGLDANQMSARQHIFRALEEI